MASVTFALNPLAWENNDSIVAAEICHIYINYLSRVRKPFTECWSNIPYNLSNVYCSLHNF